MIRKKYVIVFVRATKSGYSLKCEQVACMKNFDYKFVVWDSFLDRYTDCFVMVRNWSQFKHDIPVNSDDVLLAISEMEF